MFERIRYTIPLADRFFLLPEGYEPPPGNLQLGGLQGEESGVDPAVVAPYEVSPEEAQAHIRLQVEEASANVSAALTRLLRGLGESPDPNKLAERLGLTGGDRRAIEKTLLGVVADVKGMGSAIASGESADLERARERLERRGLDLGDSLSDLAHQLDWLRGLNQENGAPAVPEGVQAFIYALAGDSTDPLGRRLDEIVAGLQSQLGPVLGPDPERNQKQRQREYQRNARSAIADSLRAAGIAPLNDLAEDER